MDARGLSLESGRQLRSLKGAIVHIMDYGLSGEAIVCFAGEDWWYHHPHEKAHIFKRLAKQNKILFVNSLTMGLPSASNPDFFLKIRRKAKSYLRWLRFVPEGFHVMTPIVLPFFGKRWARMLNLVLLYAQIKLAMMICGIRNPIVWVHIPSAADIAERLKSKLVIYHVTDKCDANEDSALSPAIIRDFDRRMKKLADVVLYSGRKLYDEAGVPHRFLLTQGVDFDHFATEADSPAPDIADIPRPILGYFGGIDYVMDFALMEEVVRRRPDWHWAMIGLKSNLTQLSAPNLHFLGSKPYSDLPKYIKRFDVCILPWGQDHPFTRYGSAMKIRDYLATGKPIVMSPLYEYRDFPGIRFFHNADEFIAAVEDALANDTSADRLLRQSTVRDGTWDMKTQKVGQMISALLQGKPMLDDSCSWVVGSKAAAAGTPAR
jgi:glycosyltransferase involved in cell wall biosynthesis